MPIEFNFFSHLAQWLTDWVNLIVRKFLFWFPFTLLLPQARADATVNLLYESSSTCFEWVFFRVFSWICICVPKVVTFHHWSFQKKWWFSKRQKIANFLKSGNFSNSKTLRNFRCFSCSTQFKVLLASLISFSVCANRCDRSLIQVFIFRRSLRKRNHSLSMQTIFGVFRIRSEHFHVF